MVRPVHLYVKQVLTSPGMNDVLPKPFTKEGLLHMLEKHLVHLKKPIAQADGTMVAPQPVQIARQLVLKEEDSPAKSPQTVSQWNSPNQMPGVSPVGTTVPDDFAQAMRGQPVQHREVAGRVPPLVGQLVVLRRVVALHAGDATCP